MIIALQAPETMHLLRIPITRQPCVLACMKHFSEDEACPRARIHRAALELGSSFMHACWQSPAMRTWNVTL